eukprot:454622-Rhodomonas_salina.1
MVQVGAAQGHHLPRRLAVDTCRGCSKVSVVRLEDIRGCAQSSSVKHNLDSAEQRFKFSVSSCLELLGCAASCAGLTEGGVISAVRVSRVRKHMRATCIINVTNTPTAARCRNFGISPVPPQSASLPSKCGVMLRRS